MTILHDQVRQDILDRIADGALRIGDRLPPEAEYAAELGVSRSTLRRAFSDLERLGILERRKRVGTQIVSTTPRPRFTMPTSGLNELLNIDREAVFRTTEIHAIPAIRVPGYDAAMGPAPWLEVRGTRTLSTGTMPFSTNRVYVPPWYAGVEPELAGLTKSVFRAVEKKFDVVVGRVDQSVRARACPSSEAAVMGIPDGAPVLHIEARLYTSDRDLMEISVATFDPARFQVRTDVEIE